MKQISQSISNSTKSLPGRWTKATTLGCILALVFLGATSAQPKAKGTPRPLKMSGIVTFVDFAAGEMVVVGTATHLGKFVSYATWDPDYTVPLVVHADFTAANGDTLQAEFPAFVGASGDATIIGGTGRFAGASGSYVGNIFPGDPMPFTANGTISY